MIKRVTSGAKRTALKGCDRLGLTNLVRGSRWRERRLLILCYHGISLRDEHEWRPRLYMPSELFRERMMLLGEGGYRVLPLGEALERLRHGSLPPRSVVLTFDDGGYDFHARAFPILREFGYPATVYLSTYYVLKARPVFSVMSSYVLWHARGRRVETSDVTGERLELDLRTPASRLAADQLIMAHAAREGLDDDGKQAICRRLATVLGIDYDGLVDRRILQLMRPDEVRELSTAGVDFQLHTHRHRSPRDPALYRAEIRQNRGIIESLTGTSPRHFCYPSGEWRSEFEPLLEEEGVESATTCEPGIAVYDSHPLRLPRIIDHPGLGPATFRACLSGLAALLPTRSTAAAVDPPPKRALFQRANEPVGP